METKKVDTLKNSKLVLINQNEICLTGVTKVVANTETNIALEINGKQANIDGTGLTVTKLDVQNGILEATGTINAIKFSHSKQKQNIFKRLFS